MYRSMYKRFKTFYFVLIRIQLFSLPGPKLELTDLF